MNLFSKLTEEKTKPTYSKESMILWQIIDNENGGQSTAKDKFQSQENTKQQPMSERRQGRGWSNKWRQDWRRWAGCSLMADLV